MERRDAIAAAELAALIGGELHEIDSKRLDGRIAVQMHPRDFLPEAAPVRQTTNTAVIPQNVVIEQPRSRPAGSEIVGVENVNLGNLMIPMDGADPKMREAIAAYTNPAPAVMPLPAPPPVAVQRVAVQPVSANQNAISHVQEDSEVVGLLKDINKKLDLLIKRAKIQPRNKKRN